MFSLLFARARHRAAAPLLRACVLALSLAGVAGSASSQTAAQPAPAPAPPPVVSKHLAPGFSQLARDARVLIMPVDVELFSLSAGGVAEPKADWTASALVHMKAALAAKAGKMGLATSTMDDTAADEFAEQVSLHAAVARSIALHHGFAGPWALPTKEGRLDWSFADAMQPLRQRTGADHALFIWVRDSYASAERKAAIVALALLGVGLTGGSQVGYASLVDLESGRVLWFNNLVRASGDLREAQPAAESIDVLLAGFPALKAAGAAAVK